MPPGIPLPEELDRIRFKLFSTVVSTDILRKRRTENLRKISAIEREFEHAREFSEQAVSGRSWI